MPDLPHAEHPARPKAATGTTGPGFLPVDRAGSLDTLFNARSVAIAGAGSPGIGQAFLSCLLDSGYKGNIYPLSPKGGEVMGLPVYPGITDVPDQVDLVIACIPARLVLQLVRDCIAKGVKAVSFYTAGFSERGDGQGQELEQELLRVARAGGLRLLGPNCVGVYNPQVGLSFSSDNPRESGPAGLICQSGGNAIYVVRAGGFRGIRFSKAVSFGNALDIDECELLEYFGRDPETHMVGMYIEGVKDGRRFYRTLRQVSDMKPVMVLKAGHTDQGSRAAASHTGALAGSDRVWNTLLHQAGAIRVDTREELVDMMVAFTYLRVPRGKRVGVWGGGGGLSVMLIDDYNAAGFAVPASTPSLEQDIREVVSRYVNTDAGFILNNPFDLSTLHAPEGHYQVLKKLAEHEGFDMVVGQVSVNNSGWPHRDFGLTVWPDSFADASIRVHGETGKPIVVVIHSVLSNWDSERAVGLEEKCCAAGLPVFRSIESAARAMGRFVDWHVRRGAYIPVSL